MALVVVAIAALALTTALAACSESHPVAAVSGDELKPGVTYAADLDGDGASERILVDGSPASLTIVDGDVVYHSRAKWTVAGASLGDTDRDGNPEVVTLVDDEEGRHLGLFSYFGGEYRERLVTSEFSPRPIALKVVPAGAAPGDARSPAATGDLILLMLESPAQQTGSQTLLLRWNGFSFTRVESAADQ